MFTALKLREQNIAEYLLYMWQVEDTLRVYGCDEERVAKEYLSRYELKADDAKKMRQWYADLCRMMREEGKVNGDHLQINRNVVSELEELSERMLQSAKFPRYSAAYYRALPHIVEVREHGERKDISEIETCFDILYGVMLLRLQKKNVSDETAAAAADVAALTGLLAVYYKKDRQTALDL